MFLLVVFAVGLGVGALVGKLRPPVVTVSATPATTRAADEKLDGPPLKVGDKLQVITRDMERADSQNTRELVVDEKGEISIPLLGAIEARGHTVREMEEAANRGYEQRNFGVKMRVTMTRVEGK